MTETKKKPTQGARITSLEAKVLDLVTTQNKTTKLTADVFDKVVEEFKKTVEHVKKLETQIQKLQLDQVYNRALEVDRGDDNDSQ